LTQVHSKPIRRTRHALKRTEDRLEVVEGLITALNALPKVIEMITAAPDAASARASLQVHLDINERQTDAVLACPCAGSRAWSRKACARKPTTSARSGSACATC